MKSIQISDLELRTDKSCTGGITLKNVLDLSVLHSYLNQINNKTLTPNPKSGCNGNAFPTKLTLSGPCPSEPQNER